MFIPGGLDRSDRGKRILIEVPVVGHIVVGTSRLLVQKMVFKIVESYQRLEPGGEQVVVLPLDVLVFCVERGIEVVGGDGVFHGLDADLLPVGPVYGDVGKGGIGLIQLLKVAVRLGGGVIQNIREAIPAVQAVALVGGGVEQGQRILVGVDALHRKGVGVGGGHRCAHQGGAVNGHGAAAGKVQGGGHRTAVDRNAQFIVHDPLVYVGAVGVAGAGIVVAGAGGGAGKIKVKGLPRLPVGVESVAPGAKAAVGADLAGQIVSQRGHGAFVAGVDTGFEERAVDFGPGGVRFALPNIRYTGDVDIPLNDGDDQQGVVLIGGGPPGIVAAGNGTVVVPHLGGNAANMAHIYSQNGDIGGAVVVHLRGGETVDDGGARVSVSVVVGPDAPGDAAHVQGIAANGAHCHIVIDLDEGFSRCITGEGSCGGVFVIGGVADDPGVLDGAALCAAHQPAQGQRLPGQSGHT